MTDQSPSSETSDVLSGVAKPANQAAADLNAGFAFFLDCVVNLFVLSGLLIGAFNFPQDIVFGRIVPGAIVGIVVGNLAYIVYARKIVAEGGDERHTSIPLGVDLPTVFGMVFFIIGPLYASQVDTLGAGEAAEQAWMVGVAATVWMALVKVVFSFFSRAVETHLPRTAMIGTMAGIAVVWLGAEALVGVLTLPAVGMIALMIMAFTLISGHRLPFGLPGAVLAILFGTVVYYFLAAIGYSDQYTVQEVPSLVAALPQPTLVGLTGLFGDAVNFLGIIIPLALLIAASSVNVVAGARLIGDSYDPQTVVRIDSTATLLSALFGGVVQTTPYFGHTTYKRMGARTHYALGVVGVVAVGGSLGVIALASQLIPGAVLKPILMVVAADILRLSYSSTDVRHAPAVLFALVPAILNYAFTKVDSLFGSLYGSVAQALADPRVAGWVESYVLLGALSRGYILTSMIWGALLVWIIDGKLKRAAAACLFASGLTLFGVIHSVLPSSGMYVPWNIPSLNGLESLAYHLSVGYGVAAVALLILNLVARPKSPLDQK